MRKEPSAANGQQTLYQSVERKIFDAIESGEFRPGERLPPLDQLATDWGVSHGTLRQALQSLSAQGVLVRRPRRGTSVNPDYGNHVPRSESLSIDTPAEFPAESQKSQCIAMIVPDVQMFDFAAIVRGVESIAESAGFNVIIGNMEDHPERLNQVVGQHLRTSLAGMIIATHRQGSIDYEWIHQIQRRNIPVVACYRPIGLVDWPVIRTDGFANTRALTRHVAATGRKRIAWFDFAVTDESEAFFKQDGVLGYINGLYDEGLVYDRALNLEFSYTGREGQRGHTYTAITEAEVELAITWLKAHPDVDAIICARDRLAATAHLALHHLGKKVPYDVALAGFGNHGHLFGLGHDWLTSLDVNFVEIGKLACDLILSLRDGKILKPRTILTLKGQVVARQSTIIRALE